MLIPTHKGTAVAREVMADDLLTHVLASWEDCQHETLAVLADNDALTAENIQLRAELAEQAKQLATMRAA